MGLALVTTLNYTLVFTFLCRHCGCSRDRDGDLSGHQRVCGGTGRSTEAGPAPWSGAATGKAKPVCSCECEGTEELRHGREFKSEVSLAGELLEQNLLQWLKRQPTPENRTLLPCTSLRLLSG